MVRGALDMRVVHEYWVFVVTVVLGVALIKQALG
jgi:hypothetical protein